MRQCGYEAARLERCRCSAIRNREFCANDVAFGIPVSDSDLRAFGWNTSLGSTSTR